MSPTRCLNSSRRIGLSQILSKYGMQKITIILIIISQMHNSNKTNSFSNFSRYSSNLKWTSLCPNNSSNNSNNSSNSNNNLKVLPQCSHSLLVRAPLPLHFRLTHIAHSKSIISIICNMLNRSNNNNSNKLIP